MSSWGWNKNIEGGVKREGEGVRSGGRDATAGDVNNVIAPLARDVASEGIRRHVLTHSYTPCSTQYVAATGRHCNTSSLTLAFLEVTAQCSWLGPLHSSLQVCTPSLQGNSIGQCGMRVLAPAFGKCEALECVRLDANAIGTQGVNALAHHMCTNTCLTSLDLRDNSLVAADGHALLASLPFLARLS
eukprot:CAMPEP_0179443046 /NCGR_PEP_ID=MMETSP0799-20121207/26482_1 /TAXON_ID=46947 /ORGANISM="Geminigera cryophila, Strain CCMP2564" /LENGTH=186 /DNA_ID=CAMNT_0021228677 /DNA_START=154 /DNA_END=712 /DNA_ORIENTATION=+